MITHTNAFKRLKDETQDIFDFAILTAYAVPFVKHKLKEAEKEYTGAAYNSELMAFRPDGFRHNTTVGKIRDSATRYKAEIAKSIRLSSFSYFEAYVGNVIREAVAFHDPNGDLVSLPVSQDLRALSPEDAKFRHQLRDIPKKMKLQKYEKRFKQLMPTGVRFPHHALIRAGIRRLQGYAGSYRAADIPDLLFDALGFEISSTDRQNLHDIRNARNRIAHGRAEPHDKILSTAIRANYNLRELALKIDDHVLSYWMLADPVTLPYAAQ